MDSLTEFYKESKAMSTAVVLAPGVTIAAIRKYKQKQMEKKALLPLAIPLIGAGLGAVAGALTSPKGQRLSGALTGAAFGGLGGGGLSAARLGIKALRKGRTLQRAGAIASRPLARQTIKGTAGRVTRDAGIGAILTGATGGYNQPKSRPTYGGYYG